MRRDHQDKRSLDNNKSEAERWLAQARVDLENAEWNAEGKFWANALLALSIFPGSTPAPKRKIRPARQPGRSTCRGKVGHWRK